MNLIICKKLKGGGNSLKLRGKSEKVRVGGSSSSGRFRTILSFMLLIAFAFVTNGAWAAVRSITGVERIVSAGAVSLKVTFDSGETGDNHALYIAYDMEDKGADISDWAELQRGCNVAADATSATIPVSPLLTGKGYTVCRVFLTTSAAPYDTLIESLRQTSTQYIDSGIKPDPTTIASLDFQFSDASTVQQRVFGVSSDKYNNKSDNTARFSFDAYISGKGLWASACIDGKGDWLASGVSATTDRMTITLDAITGDHTVSNHVSGAVTTKQRTTTRTATSAGTMTIFAQRLYTNGSGSINNIAKGGLIYGGTITTNGAPARIYHPCVLDGCAGLYDEVSGQIFYSAVATNFEKGSNPVVCSLLAGETQLSAAPFATVLFLDYTWSGAAENWGDANAWTLDGENATWTDGENVLFATSSATVTLAANAVANAIAFNANTTIATNGTDVATLAAKSVSVAEGVTATISAPTAGALEKTGEGTLTLGSSRTDQTTLSEGTLAMASGATLDLAKLTLGTDPAKPVSLNLGGATINADLTSCMSATVGGAAGGSVAIDNGVITNTAYLRVWNGSLMLGSNVQLTMNASAERWVCVGGNNSNDESVTTKNAYLVLDGASINKSGTKNCFLGIGDFGSYPSKATMIVKNGGKSEIGDTAYVAQGCEGHLIIDGADSLLKAYDIKFCNTSRCADDENGYVVVTNGGTLAVRNLAYGSGKGKGYFRFDGGTLLATAAVTLLPAHDNLHYIVGAEGGTIDNGGNNITIAKGLSGAGTISLTGSGMTTFAAGVGAEGGVSVASGTTLALDGGSQSSFGVLTLEAGSKLDIAAQASDVAAFAATKLILPAEGAVKLTKSGGAFGEGVYAICRNSDVTVAEAEERFDFDITDMRVASWSKVDDLLVLTVKVIERTWIAEAGESFSWSEGWGENGWSDGVDAIFETAGAIASVDDDVAANSVKFKENAAINGESTLTPNIVHVAEGKEATINAPTAGELTKTGAGTLTLGSSRTDQTTLSEGTLAMSGSGTTLDWSKFTLGTDSDKPVTVRFEDGAAPTSGTWYLGSGNITSTVVKASGDWSRGGNDIHIGSGVGADTTFIHEGGSLTCSRFIRVGTRGAANSTLILSGGVIKNTNADRGSGKEPRTAIGYTSNGTLIVTNGASLAVTGQYLGISDANRMKGIVEIYDGSTVDVAYDVIFGQVSQQGWGEGKLNLHTGGTLATQVIRCSTNYATPADATAEVNFDGGILKANSSTRLIQKHDRLTVNVSAKGGTINNNGKNIIIEESFNGPGTIDLTGSGKTTFAAGVGVDAEGGVYVDTGTTLTINGTTTSCLGTLILKEGSTLDIATPVSDVAAFAATELLIPAGGKVTLTSGGGAFVEGLYAICKMSGVKAEAGANFAPSTGELAVSWSVVGDMLMLEVGDVKNTWTGAANDGNLSNHDNWYGREVPTSGNCIIGNVSGADLTVGAIFAATSITFPAGSGPITISGERTLSGITAIVNNAPVHHVFNCPIVCADGVTPDITRGKDNYMTFAGGITMYDAPKTGGGVVDYWSGNVTLTTESPVTYATNGDKNYGFLVSGTTFTFNNGKIDRMNIEAGATAVVERLVYNDCPRNSKSGSKTAYFSEVFDNGNGTIRTKEVKNTNTAVLFHSYADSDMVGGTIIAEKLTCATTVQTGGGFPYPVFMLNCGSVSGTNVSTGDYNGEGVWVIGPGGLAFGETIHDRSHFETKIGKSLGGRPAATLHSYADWTLQSSPKGRNKTALSIGSGNGGFIVIDTSHYAIGEAEYDSATSHTVTLDGQIVGGPMRVEGNGKVVFANEYNTFSGLTVTDTATVSVKAGCKLGTGAVTLEAGTILEVAESGTATIDGVLTLADGAALAFNFTERKVGPLLALASEKSLSFVGEGEKNIAVKVSGDVWPVGGKHILTGTGGFNAEGVTVSLAEGAPKWARRVYVNEDGNIVLDVKPRGTRVIVR